MKKYQIPLDKNLTTKIINIGRETDRESPQVLEDFNTQKAYVIKATKNQLKQIEQLIYDTRTKKN